MEDTKEDLRLKKAQEKQEAKLKKELRDRDLATIKAESIPDQKVLIDGFDVFKNMKFGTGYSKTLLAELKMFLIMLIAYIPVVGWFFVYGPYKYGQARYYRSVRAGEYNFKEYLSGFSKENYSKTRKLGTKKIVNMILYGLLLVIPGLFKSFQYSYAFDVMIDNEEFTPNDCLHRSQSMTKSNQVNMIKVLGFLMPFYVIGLATVTLLYVVLNPIYNLFVSKYYEEVIKQLNSYESHEDGILEVRNLRKYFPIGTNFFGLPNAYLKAVDDVSFSIKKGTTLGIVGESGCGKTTLGRTILGLYPNTSGSVYFEGQNISICSMAELNKLRSDIQIIFQDPYSSLSPRMSVGQIISEGVKKHNIVPKEEIREYVMGVMKRCGLQTHYYDRYPHEFSGGQRQRICIARALAVKPKFVVCDEPVSALDVSIQAQIINLLKDLQDEMGFTYLFISHDLSVVEHISDNVGVMYLGDLVEFSTKEDLFKGPLHPYTQSLLSSVPIPDPDIKLNRVVLTGDIPSPANPPKGCKFHTRCNKCMDICKKKVPTNYDAGNGHIVRCHLYNLDE